MLNFLKDKKLGFHDVTELLSRISAVLKRCNFSRKVSKDENFNQPQTKRDIYEEMVLSMMYNFLFLWILFKKGATHEQQQ